MVDQRRRSEHRRVDRHAAQAGLQVRELLLDLVGDLTGVGAGELLDHEEQALAVVDDRVADERLVLLDDVRDVGEAQLAVGVLDRHLAERLRAGDVVEDVADREALGRVSRKPPVPGTEASR